MGNSYQKARGSAGSKGVDFQINLLSHFLLHALQNMKNWKLSTENKLAGKFDDVVLELSDGSAILLQAKHKENKKVTLDQFLSTNSKNDDFSLPKYFFSYQDIKTKFPVKSIIICTNTQADVKTFKFLDENSTCKDSIMHCEDGVSFFTFSDGILPDLIKHSKLYLKNSLQGKSFDETIITEENMKEFLQHLQLYVNYPSGCALEKASEKLLTGLKSYNELFHNATYRDLHLKVKDWFEQPKGEYLTERRAKAMFCEIRSDKYRESLKEFKVVFDCNYLELMDSKKRVFHVVAEEEYLLHLLKVCHSLHHNTSNKILYAASDDDMDLQEQIIETFELPLYTHLIIIWPTFVGEMKLSEICDKLRGILRYWDYKRVIIVAKSNNKLAERVESTIDGYETIYESLTMEDLSEDTQEKLLKAENVVFQGEDVSLLELFHNVNTKSLKLLKSETLDKLVRGEKIEVGTQITDLNQQVSRYYVSRQFERTFREIGGGNEKITETKETISEEDIYSIEEKVVLISDSAGTGKTTVLTNLATTIKKNHPRLWVFRIELNDCTKIMRDSLKNGTHINLWKLLNYKHDIQRTNELETILFSLDRRMVLMFDGIDEVSPDYTDLIMNLLVQSEEEDSVAKVFITTRPHMAPELEMVLDATFFSLAPLTEPDTIDFFTKYWTHNLKLRHEDNHQCEKYAKMLMSKMSFLVTNSHDEKEIQFVVLPLHARMLAEVFLENKGSEEWEGCKEYLSGNDVNPKLPEKMNIAKLYEMFVEKKRDVFMEKANPSGNAMANEALVDQFEECLAYHRSFALKTILDKTTCSLLSRYSRDIKSKEVKMLKMGIVQKLDNQLCFVHRTFAEYFVAQILLEEIKHHNNDARFQRFLINEVFSKLQFNILRHFLDNFLQKLDVPADIFESYKSYFGFNDPTLIHRLAEEGDTEILRVLLKCLNFTGNVSHQELLLRNGLELKDNNDETPLHRAVFGGHLDTVKLLLEMGSDVNIVGKLIGTPLHWAVKKGRLDIVQLLLKQNADCSVADKEGRTALHFAAGAKNLKIFNHLVELGMDINAVDKEGCTPLHFAARTNSLKIFERLVKLGVDVNVADKEGCRALHYAASSNNCAIFKSLVEDGMNVNIANAQGCTALHYAVSNKSSDILEFLVNHHETDVNAADVQGRTPLHFAIDTNNYDATELLLEHGADVNFASDTGRTATHLAVFCNRLDNVEFLVTHGASVNTTDKYGNTALHFATRRNFNIVEFLVKHHADVNVADEEGRTALYFAAEECNYAKVEFLLEHGADINFAGAQNGRTALHLAISYDRWDVVEFLVKHGIDVNVADKQRRTALHLAAEKECWDVVQYLVEQGATIDVADEQGYTPLHLAALKSSRIIVELLVEKGADIANASEECRKAVQSVLLKGG